MVSGFTSIILPLSAECVLLSVLLHSEWWKIRKSAVQNYPASSCSINLTRIKNNTRAALTTHSLHWITLTSSGKKKPVNKPIEQTERENIGNTRSLNKRNPSEHLQRERDGRLKPVYWSDKSIDTHRRMTTTVDHHHTKNCEIRSCNYKKQNHNWDTNSHFEIFWDMSHFIIVAVLKNNVAITRYEVIITSKNKITFVRYNWHCHFEIWRQ